MPVAKQNEMGYYITDSDDASENPEYPRNR